MALFSSTLEFFGRTKYFSKNQITRTCLLDNMPINISQWFALMILPHGTVKNEGIFFLMLTILIALVVLAIVLRKRRSENDKVEMS
jgi:tellurite resistance protein TehA-like permease